MMKFGAECIGNYPGQRLPRSHDQAWGFLSAMSGLGQKVYFWEEGDVYDTDFEESGRDSAAPSGADAEVVETVDLAYFSGHGSENGLEVTVAGQDNQVAARSEIYWGNQGLKWLVLDCCSCLASTVHSNRTGADAITRWTPSLGGLRLLLGFRTAPLDEPNRGATFATHLRAGDTLPTAWRKAVEETDSAARWAYIYDNRTGKDKLKDKWNTLSNVNPTKAAVGYWCRERVL